MVNKFFLNKEKNKYLLFLFNKPKRPFGQPITLIPFNFSLRPHHVEKPAPVRLLMISNAKPGKYLL